MLNLSPRNLAPVTPNISARDFDAYRSHFVRIVTKHLGKLPKGEWRHFRRLANADDAIWSVKDSFFYTGRTDFAKQVTVSCSLIKLRDVIWHGPSFPVGKLGGWPVRYMPLHGVYVWGHPTDCRLLMLWLTYPAYPPAWLTGCLDYPTHSSRSTTTGRTKPKTAKPRTNTRARATPRRLRPRTPKA